MIAADRAAFGALIGRLAEATVEYLSAQVQAGAEVVKLFDSWAGTLKGNDFNDFCIAPTRAIVAALKARHPGLPVIVFPREAGERFAGFVQAVGADGIALDQSVDADWAARHVQPGTCVQGNMDPRHLITGGPELDAAARAVVRAFSGGAHIFNLGHGITPEASPDHLARLVEVVRGG
jgi:uroporphyrinogen decarboxylase